MQEQLLQHYLDQGTWDDYLTFSPCQLWPLLRGRNVFVIGDSMVRPQTLDPTLNFTSYQG